MTIRYSNARHSTYQTAMKTDECLKVKKSTFVGCLTCPLCLNLVKEATTISECLHTFCKNCILQKFEDDKAGRCPVCNVHLGSTPQEKLRPDNNLQDLRMTIFPYKKSEEVDSTSFVAVPRKRKERLLSSLGISLAKSGRTRQKVIPRKAGKSNCTKGEVHVDKFTVDSKEQLTPEEREPSQDSATAEEPSALEGSPVVAVDTTAGTTGLSSQVGVTSSIPSIHLEVPSNKTGKVPNWEQKTSVAEAVDGTNKSRLGLPAFNTEKIDKISMKNKSKKRKRASASELIKVERMHHAGTPKKRPKPCSNDDSMVCGLNKSKKKKRAIPSEQIKVERMHRAGTPKKRPKPCSRENVAPALANGCPDQGHKRIHPVWLALVSSEDWNEDTSPQVPKFYVRIRDGTMPISCIKKYLVQKLELHRESEVEVTCCGQMLEPDATISSLAKIWVQYGTRTDGLSHLDPGEEQEEADPHEFVMIMTYRKIDCEHEEPHEQKPEI